MENRKKVLLLTTILTIIVLSTIAAFAESKEPDLTDVTGIRFEPASPVLLEELIDGYLDAESEYFFGYYYGMIYQNGSTLILEKKDGTESRFVLNLKKEAFISKDGHEIDEDVTSCYSTDSNFEEVWQIDNHKVRAWGLGIHPVTVEYRGFKCETSVSVVDNKIDKIEYIKHDPLIENYDGYWMTDNNEDKYFYYRYNFGDKDMVRITRKDGTVNEYTYTEGDYFEDDDCLTEYYFRCKDGTYIILYDIYLSGDQKNNHWVKGGENYMDFIFAGRASKSQVTIVDSPIDSISYKPAVPITYRENFDLAKSWDEKTQSSYYVYRNPKQRDGDKLTVVKNGVKRVYTYSSAKSCFINGKARINAWDIDIHTYQKEKPWVLGSDNEVEFNYLGRACKVKVTVQKDKIENSMKASGKTVKVKYSRLKKKTQKIWEAQVFKVVDKEGFVTYKLAKKDKKAKNKITVSKDGTVTVKKGLKKGKYSIKVKVTASGNDSYKARTKTVTVKVNVK